MLEMNAEEEWLENRTQMLLRGLRNSHLCVLYQDNQLAVRLVDNVPDAWPSVGTIITEGDYGIFDFQTAQRIEAVKREVLRSGVAANIEAARYEDSEEEPVWFDLHVEPDCDENDQINGLFVTAIDITQLKRREESLRALLYEVSHRSRNLLAILQGILGQTVRHSTDTADFERKFRGRISALAHSQDLITHANWSGVRFRQLLDRHLASYLPKHGPDISITGIDAVLNPTETLYIGLGLHELTMNSVGYGVLKSEAGRIDIDVALVENKCRLRWSEKFAQPLHDTVRAGFGRAILERIVTLAVSGVAKYQISADSVEYELVWSAPLTNPTN